MYDFVVDLEIAKELKDNGFPQKTKFNWDKSIYDKKWDIQDNSIRPINFMPSITDSISGPISEEILKELSKIIETPQIFFLYINCLEGMFNVYYQTNSGEELIEIFDKKLSNALGKCYIFLKQNGYL